LDIVEPDTIVEGRCLGTPVSRAAVVELVGPAAAGKTSLRRVLALRSAGAQTSLHLRWPQFVPAAVGLTPTLLGVHRPFRGLLWKEMKRMVYVGALRRALERPGASARPVILDEGPIYMLARLRVFGEDRLGSRAFERWWREAVREWAVALSLIVRLDAPDAVLIERLRSRIQSHPLRGHGDEAISRFLEAYRNAYDAVIEALMAADGAPRLLIFRTDEQPVDRIADAVAPYLLRPNPGGP
jgi:hypothetical protein